MSRVKCFRMKLIIRYIFILIHILAFFVLGCFVAVKYNMELSIDKSVVPMFFQVFIANLASSVFLMLSNLLFGLGLLGVTYLAFSLGIQFYTVVLAYGANNLLIVSVLSIHGIFEIAVMMIIFNVAISNLSIWKSYLFGDSKSLTYSYKVFFKTTFIRSIVWIFIFTLIGSLLEVNVSTYLFRCLS